MINPDAIRKSANEFVSSLPPVFSNLTAEMQAHLQRMLENWLKNMELVTREEFDIQVQVLGRTRRKLEDLEEKLSRMFDYTT